LQVDNFRRVTKIFVDVKAYLVDRAGSVVYFINKFTGEVLWNWRIYNL